MSLTFDESIANMLEIGNIPITERPPMDVPCIQLVSTQINNGDNISIVVLRSPHLIPLDTIEKLFRITLVYTSRAFLDDVNTISADDRQDHFSHTFLGGGNVFLLGKLSSIIVQGKTLISPGSSSIQIFAHANFHTYDIPNTDNHKALYLSGVCCDPHQQSRGFATTLMTESIKVLRLIENVKYLTLRTMNHAVVKLCKRSCRNNTISEEERKEVPVYPVDVMENRPDLIHVCNTISNIFGWKDVVPEHLIIKQAYPAHLIPIFRGEVDPNKKDPILDRMEAIFSRDQGDAIFCIVDL